MSRWTVWVGASSNLTTLWMRWVLGKARLVVALCHTRRRKESSLIREQWQQTLTHDKTRHHSKDRQIWPVRTHLKSWSRRSTCLRTLERWRQWLRRTNTQRCTSLCRTLSRTRSPIWQSSTWRSICLIRRGSLPMSCYLRLLRPSKIRIKEVKQWLINQYWWKECPNRLKRKGNR